MSWPQISLTILVAASVSVVHLDAQQATGLTEPSEGDLRRTVKIDPDDIDLPPRVSLERYLPLVGDQGNLGSCASWAAGYYLATSIFAQWYSWPLVKSNSPDPDHVMSPAWIFKFLYPIRKELAEVANKDRKPSDPLIPPSDIGLDLITVGRFLSGVGALPLKHLAYDDSKDIPFSTKEEIASLVSIANSFKLPSMGLLWDRRQFRASSPVKRLKAALSQGSPAIIGACINSKLRKLTKPFVWKESKDTCVDKNGKTTDDRHALTVVGYDDTFEGGAFRVVNSWGDKWADNGYAWLSYDSLENIASLVTALEEVPDISDRKSNDAPHFKPRPNTLIIPGENVALWSSHWSEIKSGDILETVFKKLGSPSNISELRFLRGINSVTPMPQIWIYTNADTGDRFLVEWSDGVVKRADFLRASKAPAADAKRVELNRGVIRGGMTSKMLFELLGGPTKAEIKQDPKGGVNDDLWFSGPNDDYRILIKLRDDRVVDFQQFHRSPEMPVDLNLVSQNWKRIQVNDSFATVFKLMRGPNSLDIKKWYGLNSRGYIIDGSYIWRGNDGLIVVIDFSDGFVSSIVGTQIDPMAPASNPVLVETNWSRLHKGDSKAAVYLIMGGPDQGQAYVHPETLEPLNEFPWHFSPSNNDWVVQIQWSNGRISSIEKLLKAKSAPDPK